MTHPYLSQARQIYRQVLSDILARQNVLGVGLGYKERDGKISDELSLIISVAKKLPVEQLAPQDLIPKAFQGLITDVVETGYIRAFPENPRARRRPAQPGISVGHHAITAGTFGLLVQRDGVPFILSNNHVLANCNEAQAGDAIYQPGPSDGGTDAERVATLAEFEPLDYGKKQGECSVANAVTIFFNGLATLMGSSHRLEPVQVTPGNNMMDAALARPLSPDLVVPQILEIGLPVGVAEPELGMEVQKTGRTTGHTEGVVTQIDATVNVDYNGRNVRFSDQIFTTSMSSPGDSGSGILDMERHAVGLLFAGSERVTIFTPLQRVLDHFGITLVTA